jgi:hypothetical protein
MRGAVPAVPLDSARVVVIDEDEPVRARGSGKDFADTLAARSTANLIPSGRRTCLHQGADMKKTAKKRQKGPAATGSPERESFYLERLCEELEHDDPSRRNGARAALVWLGQLVHHYAQTGTTRLESNELSPVESPDSLSVERRVGAIERSIFEREQERQIARDHEEPDFEIILN